MATIQLILNAVNNASKSMDAVAASATAAANRVDDLNSKIDVTSAAMTAQGAAAGRAADQLDRLALSASAAAAAQKAAADAAEASGAKAGFAYFGWRRLLGTITLFGGMASITGLHLALDVLAEILAVVVPAGVALGAFGIAASDAVMNVVRHFTDLHTVMDATGKAIYPMTGALEALHKAVQPDVYQILGDALLVVNSRMGEFRKLAMGTGQVLDQLAARAAVALESAGVSQFLRNAIPDVAKLGDIIGNIFGIIGNLLKTLPGYAEALLNVLDGVTRGLEAVTGSGVVQGITKMGLAFHGAFIYMGLAATAVMALRGPMTRLGSLFVTGALNVASWGESAIVAGRNSGILAGVMDALSVVPVWGWVAIGAAALAGLVFWLTRSKSATQQWIDQLQAGVNNAQSWTQLMQSLASAQLQVGMAIVATTAKLSEMNPQMYRVRDSVRDVGGAYADQQQKLSDLLAAQQKFSAEQQLAISRMDSLAKQAGGYQAALGLMTQAHVKVSDAATASASAWKQDVQQVLALQEGLRAMANYAAGSATTSLQILDQQASDQYQAIQKVNGAWDTFIGNATRSQTAFDTYMTGLTSMSTAAGTASQRLLSAQAAQASAQNTLNNLMSRGGASALQLTSAEDRLAAAHDRLGALEKSRATTAAQLASAQASVASSQNTLNNLLARGGASALQLAAAHDRLAAATSRVNTLESRGAASMDGLNAASIALNQAFAQQVSNTNALYDTWRTAGIANDLFTAGVKASIAPLLKYASGSQEATDQLVGLAEEAGYQGPASLKALTAWLGNTHDATQKLKDITDQATQQEALLSGAMHAQGNLISGQLLGDINQAILKYDGVAKAAQAYGQAVAQDGRDSAAAHAARQTLINDLIKSGEAAGDSQKQIAAMITKVLGIPAKRALQLVMTGEGTFSVFPDNRTGLRNTVTPAALGTYVARGRRGVDDQLILAQRGELVVPAPMVRAGAVDHLRGAIPGFAMGGLVEGGNTSVLTGQYAVTSYDKFTKQVTDALASALRQEMQASSGGISGDVASYANVVRTALGMLGQPLTDVAVVLRQIATESGGNQFAVNRSDINWLRGTPSVGLLQVIGPTFARWAGPFRGTGPFLYGVSTNPLANLFSGLNYAVHTYPDWTSVLGQGHGYASGGIISEPIAGIGLRSGSPYSFGEAGIETVTPGIGGRGVNINISEMNVRHESDVALVAQRLSGMIRMASLGGGARP